MGWEQEGRETVLTSNGGIEGGGGREKHQKTIKRTAKKEEGSRND